MTPAVRPPDPTSIGRFAWRASAGLVSAGIALLAGCANAPAPDARQQATPAEARALISRALPPSTPDRAGWATDIYAAFATLDMAPTAENVCAVLAITEQESGYRVNPSVPGLAAIAWREIDARADRAGVPTLLVHAALRLSSANGKSYAERIDAATTELDLSRVFDDIIDTVPLGKRLFGNWNPVHTAGPMQVSIAYAESHMRAKPYPYPMAGTVRDEVFTRRGGMYFGIAHLLGYPASYDALIFRYADFNAGHYASRNAAFQNAVSTASGIPLDLDGDMIAFGRDASQGPGQTELAVRILGKRLGFDEGAVHDALVKGETSDFERTTLYRRVFELADRSAARPLPRALLPNIRLQSPKITRKLTTEWFAKRVDERQKRCLARAAAASA